MNLKPGTYYWSVQTIDTGLFRSDWSRKEKLVVSSLLSISPDSGPAGTPITMKGMGFNPKEGIQIGKNFVLPQVKLKRADLEIPAYKVDGEGEKIVACFDLS